MVCDPERSLIKFLKLVLILILLEYGLRRLIAWTTKDGKVSLNPYSTGIWSATPCHLCRLCSLLHVLILILLEYGLRPLQVMSITAKRVHVLILILLEYGLRPLKEQGIKWVNVRVLILILLEYGLRPRHQMV